ncbi:MAG: HU family DNA-binding protein [Bryobacteraceae bacterium]
MSLTPLRVTNTQAQAMSKQDNKTRTLTRTDLVADLVSGCNISYSTAEVVLETILSSITRAIQHGDRVEIRRFGSFFPHGRDARVGRNPRTGGPLPIAPKKVAKFRASRELLALVNGETLMEGNDEV